MKREEVVEVFSRQCPKFLMEIFEYDPCSWGFQIKDWSMLNHISLIYNGVRAYFDGVFISDDEVCFYKKFINGNIPPESRRNKTYGSREVASIGLDEERN